MITPNQVQELLDIMESQFAVFIGTQLGEEYLTSADQQILKDQGVDYHQLYAETSDPIKMNFQLGLLSQVIGDAKVKDMPYHTLKGMIQAGAFVKPNLLEQEILRSIKQQSLKDIKAMQGRIFNDVNGIIATENIGQRKYYEEIIRDEITAGIRDRKSRAQIASDLLNKTGDWSRDFSKMVEYISHAALNEGRLSMIKRKGKDLDVYFQVQPGACKHCVKNYLTNGVGSQPVIFSIAELEANGINIGRKANEWLATIFPLHPFCRCLLTQAQEGYIWDAEKKRFRAPKGDYKPTVKRPKIKVTIGDKVYLV